MNFQQTAGIVIAFEIVGAFVVRVVVAQLLARPALIRLIPFAISAYLTLGEQKKRKINSFHHQKPYFSSLHRWSTRT